jgi:hypothetical protein
MIVLKTIGLILVGLYASYLAVGFLCLLYEVFHALVIILAAPLWQSKRQLHEYETYFAPLPELLRQLPIFIYEQIKFQIFWFILPFWVCWALFANKLEKEVATE